MDRPVLAHVRVPAWAIPVTLLTDQNFARIDGLAAKALYAAPFGPTISAVIGGTSGFLVCHSSGILKI